MEDALFTRPIVYIYRDGRNKDGNNMYETWLEELRHLIIAITMIWEYEGYISYTSIMSENVIIA